MIDRMRGTLMTFAALLLLGASPASVGEPQCTAKPERLDLGVLLPRSREAIDARQQIEIVAIGSSSTAGYGATSLLRSYPAELIRTLTADLTPVQVRVLNRGVGGEDIGDMLARFAHDVVEEQPDLVVWQLGTNDALRAENLDGFRRELVGGIEQIRETGADLILMNLQFAPAVVALPNEEAYLAIIREVARAKGVGLFPRFEIMKDWYDTEGMAYGEFLIRDGLHLNDFGYECIGRLLGQAIERSLASR